MLLLFQAVVTDKCVERKLRKFLQLMGKNAADRLRISPEAMASQVLSIIKSRELDGDIAILQALALFFDFNKKKKKQSRRGPSRLVDIKEELSIILDRDPPVSTYLDIGCGNGEITAAVAGVLLPCLEEDAHACDLPGVHHHNPQPSPRKNSEKKKKRNTPPILFSECSSTHLPYESNSFDLITMFMSAHHFLDVDIMFRETRRVARPGSFLLMREHGVVHAPYYDIVHALYCCTNFMASPEITPEEFMVQYNRPEKYARYHTAKEWMEIAKQQGFFPVKRPRFKKGDTLFHSVYMLFRLRGGKKTANQSLPFS